MKKVLLVAVILLAGVSLATAGGITLKGLLGYGFLLSPSLPDISAFTEASETKGGINFAVQGLFGDKALKFGAELGYLSMYSLSYDSPAINLGYYTVAAYTWEMSLSAIPILGLVQYNLGDPAAQFKPYVQAGLGFYLASVSASAAGITASESELDLGMKLGVGGALQLNPEMDLDFSLNYYNVFITGGASTLNIEAGIAYRL